MGKHIRSNTILARQVCHYQDQSTRFHHAEQVFSQPEEGYGTRQSLPVLAVNSCLVLPEADRGVSDGWVLTQKELRDCKFLDIDVPALSGG